MRPRIIAWLAWSPAGLSGTMLVASFPLYGLVRSAQVPASWGADLNVVGQLEQVLFLAFPLVGALLASRRPRIPIGWLLLAVGLLWMLSNLTELYSVYGVAEPGSVPFPVGVAGIVNWTWVPAVGLLGTYPFLLFPDGRLPSRRWRPLAWLSGVVIVVLSIGFGLAPEPLPGLGGVRNPFAVEGHPWIRYATYVVIPLLPVCVLASAASLVLRYRNSGGEVRQQIKWIAFAASFAGLMLMINFISSSFFSSETQFTPSSPLWLDLLAYAVGASFTAVPIAMGFAVLRYRLYDIDIIINRALVYSVLTVSLVLVYLGGVAATQTAFRLLTGQERQPQLAVVASTLIIAALFSPLRRRVQAFVNRRFYRSKYDAARTLADFGARLRDDTDLDTLGEDLVVIIRDTMQPAHVSLWLRTPGEPG